MYDCRSVRACMHALVRVCGSAQLYREVCENRRASIVRLGTGLAPSTRARLLGYGGAATLERKTWPKSCVVFIKQ